ncbi:MAG: NAD-binding protein, partial [Stellaceae bacterium]
TALFRTRKFLHMGAWFPHVPLALLLILGGLWLLWRNAGPAWPTFLRNVVIGTREMPPAMLPIFLVGIGMILVGLGLLLRSRVAWTMALMLTLAAAASTIFGQLHAELTLLGYFAAVAAMLLIAWNSFDRASLAASTLFAFTAVAMLLTYATFGAFYLGPHFRPAIKDLLTALYYAIVTMSTVGYGDIVPVSPEAKLFSISVIVLGVAVFATSLTAVIAPLVTSSINRVVSRKGRHMKQSNHFIVVGNTALAVNTCRELTKRGRPVVRILREKVDSAELSDTETVFGDPSSIEVLNEAGAERAQCVLALTADDSENAFIVLAVKELGRNVRTVAAVNDAHHLGRVQLVRPDLIIAPQVLGGELMAMMLSGETVTPEFVMERVFHQNTGTT